MSLYSYFSSIDLSIYYVYIHPRLSRFRTSKAHPKWSKIVPASTRLAAGCTRGALHSARYANSGVAMPRSHRRPQLIFSVHRTHNSTSKPPLSLKSGDCMPVYLIFLLLASSTTSDTSATRNEASAHHSAWATFKSPFH